MGLPPKLYCSLPLHWALGSTPTTLRTEVLNPATPPARRGFAQNVPSQVSLCVFPSKLVSPSQQLYGDMPFLVNLPDHLQSQVASAVQNFGRTWA